MNKHLASFIGISILTIVAVALALPKQLPFNFEVAGRQISGEIGSPVISFSFFGKPFYKDFTLKQGLDIQGGMRVVLDADMTEIPELERQQALQDVQEVMLRRVDQFGINEPVVQTAVAGDEYRIIVELAGISDPNEALRLLGTTANLAFKLETEETQSLQAALAAQPELATQSAALYFDSFEDTGIGGAQLRRASVQYDPNTGEPVIQLDFNDEGTQLFADVTTNNVGQTLAIFIDNYPVTAPVIQVPILTGTAQITGGFGIEEARELAIILNSGALPVPISIAEQRTIGASLGQASVTASLKAGIIGIGLVMLFMILYYKMKGFLASLALLVYSVLTIAVYKILGVTLTLPGIAGLLLSIGMAVDANILIFERMKEELRLGKPFDRAMELGFGRAWDSIKDANLATIATALILINPLDFSFLNTSGLVRGFGLTLLIGVLISLFTGVVVTRTLMRLFLAAPNQDGKGAQ
jgi:preprotein translocase subunit SecD